MLLWITATVLDSETFGIIDPQPLAPEVPPDPNETARIALGKKLPPCALCDLDGNLVDPFPRPDQIPTVIEFGSFTCKYCTGEADNLDDLAEKYEGKIRFVLVYTEEAHPGRAFFPQGYNGRRDIFTAQPTKEQRLTAAIVLRDTMSIQREVLIDDVNDETLCDRVGLHIWQYHSGIVVNDERRIVYASKWLKAANLDEFLAQYIASDGKCEPMADDTGP